MTSNQCKRDIVKGFFEHGVVKINTSVPFVLASGQTSPVYFDHRRIFSQVQLRRLVVKTWAVELLNEFEKRSIRNVSFAGTATAGIAPAFALADYLESSFVYVRSNRKSHGTGQLVEGIIRQGESLVVVDDMVTTGGSLVAACENLRDEGNIPVLATAITSHDRSDSVKNFQRAEVPFFSLFKSREIFSIACQQGLVSEQEEKSVLQWIAQI